MTVIIELVLIRVLEKLLESGALETVRELGLDMYNFYHRQGLGLSWARRGQYFYIKNRGKIGFLAEIFVPLLSA